MSRLILPEGFNKKPMTKKEEKKEENKRSCVGKNTPSNRMANGCFTL